MDRSCKGKTRRAEANRKFGREDHDQRLPRVHPISPSTDASLRCPGVKVYPVDTKWQDVIKDEEGVLFFDQKLVTKFFSVSLGH